MKREVYLPLETFNELVEVLEPLSRFVRTKYADAGYPNIYLGGVTFLIKEEES